MFGKITKISGKKLEIELDEDVDMYRVQRLSDGKQPSVELTVQDGRHITSDQRGKIWALIHVSASLLATLSNMPKTCLKVSHEANMGLRSSV